jgi:hypothetical protein
MKMTPTTTRTPLHTPDWYIKWVSSVVLLIGMLLTANQIHPLNLFVTLTGCAGWLVVAILWKDRALIFTNTVAITILMNGLIKHFI